VPTTALYSGLLAFVLIVLSVRVIQARRGRRVAVGDGGDEMLLRRMRAHGNFTEYVPIALLLMALAESLGGWPWLLHAAGVVLVAGRIAHAYGVSEPREDFRFRVTGMVATLNVIGILGLTCVALSAGRLLGP
jgi:hypothetical protein